MDGIDRFDETVLPSQSAFYNKLSGSSCSDTDYAYAVSVWDAFGCETLGDYHVYLQLGVLLLADLFEKFRRTCLEFYKLDPLHYFTTPGLAWDTSLRMSRVDLELITDENIYNMVENSRRGGISMISTRHAKANNPRLPSYDPELPRQDLIYLDANNLYGHAMSQYLPTGGGGGGGVFQRGEILPPLKYSSRNFTGWTTWTFFNFTGGVRGNRRSQIWCSTLLLTLLNVEVSLIVSTYFS